MPCSLAAGVRWLAEFACLDAYLLAELPRLGRFPACCSSLGIRCEFYASVKFTLCSEQDESYKIAGKCFAFRLETFR